MNLFCIYFFLQRVLCMCHLQLNVHVYVQTPSGEAFVSQLLSVHSPLYYLPETGIARLVVKGVFSLRKHHVIF